MSVKSPISGFVSGIHVSENSYAQTGTLLMSLLRTDGVMIKANVPSIHSNKIASVNDANIKFPNSSRIHTLDELGGKVLSFGHSVEANTGMVPLYLGLGKADIIAGTFVELWLKTDAAAEQIDGRSIAAGSMLVRQLARTQFAKQLLSKMKSPVFLGNPVKLIH